MGKRLSIFLEYIKNWLLLFFILFLFGLLPVISTWLRDRPSITLQDIILPVLLNAILTVLIAALFVFPFNKNRLAGIVGGIFTVFIIGHQYNGPLFEFQNQFNQTEEFYFALILFFSTVIIGLLLALIIQKVTKKIAFESKILYRSICIGVVVAFIIQFYPFVKAVIVQWPQFFYQPDSLVTASPTDQDTTKPDIYYIVPDRYTSQDILRQDFDFDNSEFINFLTENNFYVPPDAKSNYPFTAMSVASTLMADYNSDVVTKFQKASLQTVQPYHRSIHYSPVIRELKNLGYTYYHIGNWYEATSQAPLADELLTPFQLTLFNKTYIPTGSEKKSLSHSIFWSIIKKRSLKIGSYTIAGLDRAQGGADYILEQFKTLDQIADGPSGNRFIFAHIMSPHPPYYFNPDGSLSDNIGNNNIDTSIKEKYTDQILFLNQQFKKLIQKINANSNNQAIIVIQSDEGPYPIELLSEELVVENVLDTLDEADMREWSQQYLEMKYGILAAYHLPEVNQDMLSTAADPANIFRLVFNTYFNQSFEYLPKCYYTFPQGRHTPFIYDDITKKLTGEVNAGCSSNGS